MKKAIALSFAALALAACSTSSNPELGGFDYGPDVVPIRGSITYGDTVPRRSPLRPGTRFTHEFYDRFGSRVTERYRVTEDGTLQLFSRRIYSISTSGN